MGCKERLSEVELELAEPDVWNDADRAQILGRERSNLQQVVTTIDSLFNGLNDASELLKTASAESDSEMLEEVDREVKALEDELSKLEFRRMFSGESDENNAFLDIQSGSGGTEAQDWAEMLIRMYLRWADSHDCKTEWVEESVGEEAGIKSATLKIVGPNAYGWLKTESGIHRLVRISPYDSSARRHTSFASIGVYPVIDDAIDILIEDKDLRVDTYRASGAGGQHVNRTDSAVRITHEPTGIVVQCQNDRSQHKNRATAMGMLKARLYELELQKRDAETQAKHDAKNEIGWGHQIRSYVLQPYQMVKDLRTGVETSNTTAVLDGAIDQFLESALSLRVQGEDEN